MRTSSSRALRQMGWGFVFELIDIRIEFFDILPDFIGYILIASAIYQLKIEYPIFNKVKWVAIAMILLSLPGVLMYSNVSYSDFASLPLALHVYSQALVALHIVLVYGVFNGLIPIAQQMREKILLDSILFRRTLYMVVSISQLVFYPFFLNHDSDWIMLYIAFGVLSFILEVLFIRLPFRVSRMKWDSENINKPRGVCDESV